MEEMGKRDLASGIGAYVAIGDSFTEGLHDPGPDGGYLGWADRVADALSARRPGFRYANLAIRGKLLGEVVAEQLPRAVELAPDLVSLAAGGNDILQRGRRGRTRRGVRAGRGQAAGGRLPGAHLHRLRSAHVPGDPAAARPDRGVQHAPARHRRRLRVRPGRPVVHAGAQGPAGLESGPAAPHHRRPPAGSPARLRGPGRSGRRGLAGAAASGAARTRPPGPGKGPAKAEWLAARREDARWARVYAAPWVRRRFGGTSSGDGLPPKRPDLLPV